MRRSGALAAALARIALALAPLACGGDAGEAAAPLGPAPAFVLPLLGGGEVDLAALRGRMVVLDFWATWCAPCEVQMPILDALWQERGGGRLMIVGISVDTDPPATVAKWVEERGFGYPIALGDQELAMRYGLLGFPSLIVVDEAGRIRVRHTGVWTRDEIDDQLEAIRRAPLPEPDASPVATPVAGAGPEGAGEPSARPAQVAREARRNAAEAAPRSGGVAVGERPSGSR
ncbi:MAG: TlpA disulfide reductase family protein [Myxococcota bacterium]